MIEASCKKAFWMKYANIVNSCNGDDLEKERNYILQKAKADAAKQAKKL